MLYLSPDLVKSPSAAFKTLDTFLNVVGVGLTADANGNKVDLYLPPPGVSLGLAIALGG